MIKLKRSTLILDFVFGGVWDRLLNTKMEGKEAYALNKLNQALIAKRKEVQLNHQKLCKHYGVVDEKGELVMNPNSPGQFQIKHGMEDELETAMDAWLKELESIDRPLIRLPQKFEISPNERSALEGLIVDLEVVSSPSDGSPGV